MFSDLSINNPTYQTVPHKPALIPIRVNEETFDTTLQVAVEELSGLATGGA